MHRPRTIRWLRRAEILPVVAALTIGGILLFDFAAACPFCTPVGPTLAQQRDRAAAVALAELNGMDEDIATLEIRQVLKGQDHLQTGKPLRLPITNLAIDRTSKPGSLWLLFSQQEVGQPLAWSTASVNETSFGYFVREPGSRRPVAERLRYFTRYLEHADRTIAEDAYLEFAHARFDEVGTVAEVLDMASLRRWLADANVPDQRKGLYGLLLGLATVPAQQRANQDFLSRELDRAAAAPLGTDFRPGFDGLLGGYVLLAGDEGVARITTTILANRQAPEGNVRHAITALRFAHEFAPRISRAKLAGAMSQLLARANLASVAITDLARWQAWEAIDDIAALYARDGYPQPATRHAVVGYLRVCPLPAATTALAGLRRDDPRGVAEAEEYLRRFGGLTNLDNISTNPTSSTE